MTNAQNLIWLAILILFCFYQIQCQDIWKSIQAAEKKISELEDKLKNLNNKL